MDFDTPRPLEQLLDWTLERMEHGIVQMTNPRYFGLFNPGANFPSQCADRIASVFNPQLASSASSPVPVALESHVIRAVAHPRGIRRRGERTFRHGRFGGQLHGAAMRAHRGPPAICARGRARFPGRPAFYTSRECHIAWLKIAHQAGVGRGALRLIATDGRDAWTRMRCTGDPRRSRGRHRSCHAGGHRRHDRRRHDRSAARLCGYRPARGPVVSRRRGLGWRGDRLRAHAGAGRGHRAGRLDHDRCPQVAGDDHGLRDLHHDARRRSCRRPFTPPRASCPRASPASIPTSIACNGRAASSGCACFFRWPRPAGRDSARTSSAASR